VDPVHECDADDREFPPQYARKLVYTIQGDEDEADKAELLSSTYARRPLIRRDWADGSSDWYARADDSRPTQDDLIEPRFAACLQVGYFNELMPISAPASFDRVLEAALCLEGRVVEDQRIELINYLRHAKRCDQSDAFAVCYRLSQRSAAMLKDNQTYYNWFVLGRELGLCMVRRIIGTLSSKTEGLNYLSLAEVDWDQWLTGKVKWDELNTTRGCWHWDGFPSNLHWIEIQPLFDVLADGWQLFPLPSTQRIEILLSYHLPADPLNVFEAEEISLLARYLDSRKPAQDAKDATITDRTKEPVLNGGEDSNSSQSVLRTVTEMIKGTNPNFTEIRGLMMPELYAWSDAQVCGLLELKRLSETAEMLRSVLKQWDAPDKSTIDVQRKCGGNNQRIRFILRILERLGEYDGFGKDKAAR